MPPQTVAIEDEPFDSRMSETMRIVYGNASSAGSIGASARSREGAVADLAAAGAAQELHLAHREGREVVVEQERAARVSPSYSSMICASSEVPSVAVTRACVSPRVKSAEPWVRGRTPTSQVIGRICVEVAAVEALVPLEDRLAGQDLDEVVERALATCLRRSGSVLGHERGGGLLDGLDLGVGGDLVRQRHRRHHRAFPRAAHLGDEGGGVGLGGLPRRLQEAAPALERRAARRRSGCTASWPKRIASIRICLGDLAGARPRP